LFNHGTQNTERHGPAFTLTVANHHVVATREVDPRLTACDLRPTPHQKNLWIKKPSSANS
jgi:hypothetical protein